MPTILIVEDDFAIRQVIAEVLEEEGYRTASAADGREALRYLELRLEIRQSLPSLILTDLMMPGMDGRTLIEVLVHRPAFAAIPVIVMTGQPDLARNLPPVSAVLKKPFGNSSALLDLVHALAPASSVGVDPVAEFAERPETQPYGSKTDDIDTLRGRPAPGLSSDETTDTQKLRTRPPKK